MKKIKIFDTTLRDGEQSPGASLSVNEKFIIAKQLAKLGVDVIEAGFPIASKGDFQAVQLIAKNVKGPIICGLARCSKKDIDACFQAIKYSKKPRIHVFIATSQIHLENKLRKSKQEVIEIARESVKYARTLVKDVEFSPEDASRTDIDYMCNVITQAIKAGATTINIPDTVGYAIPEEFGQTIKNVIERIQKNKLGKNITISVHCHNDLGLSVANSLAAVRNGATQVECTINGLGERAGNAALEEFVMALETRKKYFDCKTNINTKELCRTSKLVSSLTGLLVQRNKAIVGLNAFAHEAGIHQHGVISDKKTYEIMTPESVGWQGESLVIGKHSGKHAVESILKDSQYEVKNDELNEIIAKIKDLADRQKSIHRDDVLAIANDVVNKLSTKQQIVILDELAIHTGNRMTPSATVGIIISGRKKIGTAIGVGPVDAACKAIAGLIGPNLKLKEYNLKAITGGTDALASVSIRLEDNDKNHFTSEAVSADVIMASVEAYIKGINKALNFSAENNLNNNHLKNKQERA